MQAWIQEEAEGTLEKDLIEEHSAKRKRKSQRFSLIQTTSAVFGEGIEDIIETVSK